MLWGVNTELAHPEKMSLIINYVIKIIISQQIKGIQNWTAICIKYNFELLCFWFSYGGAIQKSIT